jgi:undecaprenyl-diphosphatase
MKRASPKLSKGEYISIAVVTLTFIMEYINLRRDCVYILVLLRDNFPQFISELDKALLVPINPGLTNPIVSEVMILITLIGGLWPTLGIISTFYIRGKRRVGTEILIAYVISMSIAYILKLYIDRPRPFMTIPEVDNLICTSTLFSFPSGHMVRVAAIAGALLYLYKGRVRDLSILASLLVGFSRLYLGVHYPSDVIFGGALGYVMGYLVVIFLEKNMPRVDEWIQGRG